MKTISISSQSNEINALLDQARQEDLIVRTPDGSEFVLVAINAFDLEIARTRQNAKLMALLDERGKKSKTVPLDDVKQQLGMMGEAGSSVPNRKSKI